jgi:hypothetical protein
MIRHRTSILRQYSSTQRCRPWVKGGLRKVQWRCPLHPLENGLLTWAPAKTPNCCSDRMSVLKRRASLEGGTAGRRKTAPAGARSTSGYIAKQPPPLSPASSWCKSPKVWNSNPTDRVLLACRGSSLTSTMNVPSLMKSGKNCRICSPRGTKRRSPPAKSCKTSMVS